MGTGVNTDQGPSANKVAAFNHESWIAKTVGILGLIITIGGAVQSVLQPGTHAALIVGAVITVASQAQHALAHTTFQGST